MPVPKPPQLSVHIMLPETVDRRLERWTNKLAGASWPAWGGHITLVPHFIEKGEAGAARAALQQVCSREEPFQVRFGAPIAVPDATRPDYSAVFLTADSIDADAPRPTSNPNVASNDGDHQGEQVSAIEANKDSSDDRADEQPSHLRTLRQRLLDTLAPVRDDLYPQLIEQPFLPHVTLALGLGELEANTLVREIRADPLTMAFKVEVVWLVTQSFGDGARFDRDPIPLGRVAPVELLRD